MLDVDIKGPRKNGKKMLLRGGKAKRLGPPKEVRKLRQKKGMDDHDTCERQQKKTETRTVQKTRRRGKGANNGFRMVNVDENWGEKGSNCMVTGGKRGGKNTHWI